MRFVVLFCIVFGSVATLRADAPDISSETDLARSYYSAIRRNDQTGAEKALKQLQKHYSDDAITQLVIDHWKGEQNGSNSKNWQQIRDTRKTSRGKTQPRPDVATQTTKTYQVADLVVPGGPSPGTSQKMSRNVETLIDLIRDSNLDKAAGETAVFHEPTLSLVVRGSEDSHAKCQRLFNQLRRQNDLQLTYEITLASIEPELANTFSLRETISPAVLQKRLDTISASNDSSLIGAPKVTLFDDQIATIETSSGEETTNINLHGKMTDDRRFIRTEINLSLTDHLTDEEFKFATSELVADGQPVVFFVKSADENNGFFDRRLLIEKGIEVEPSNANQIFMFVTPRIIILEEEEELIGGNSTWPSYAPYPTNIVNYNTAGYPSYPLPPTAWTPAKLEWDDGYWDLDFSSTPNGSWKIVNPNDPASNHQDDTED